MLILRNRAKLVAIDNEAHLFTCNGNDRAEVTRFANALKLGHVGIAFQHSAKFPL